MLSYYELNNIPVSKFALRNEFDKKFNPKKAEKQINTEFNAIISEYIKVQQDSKKISKATIKKYNTLANNLKKFENHYKKELSYIDFASSGDFSERWLFFCYNKLNHTDNTVGRSFKTIKTFLRYSRKKGYHNVDFSHLKGFEQETDDIALTKKELFEFYHFDFGTKKYLERARDVFCIGCFTGQRFSDFSVFEKLDYNIGIIEKRAKKTTQKSMIPVDANPYLKALLEKYNWKLPKISDQKFRDYIKRGLMISGIMDYPIKKLTYRGVEVIEEIFLKWQMVGSHTARRTFISLALEDGWTYKEVMSVAGIKDVETVVKYDKVNAERLSKKVSETFN